MVMYAFNGVEPVYVQGRFIVIDIDFPDESLTVTEFENASISDNTVETFDESLSQCFTVKEVYRVILPDELKNIHLIGRLTCIGCVDNVFICQYITKDKEYVRFMTIDTGTKDVHLFEDTHHYFYRDSVIVQPVGCLISPDKSVCLLRLPQTILTPNKWSKVIECKKSDQSAPLGQHNHIVGTERSRFRDRRFQLLAFNQSFPSRLTTILVNSYCSKCKIIVYDFEIGKEAYQTSRRLPCAEVYDNDVDLDYDSDDEDLTYFFLMSCSMVFTRSGDTLVLTCGVIDNRSNTFCNVYFFNSKTYELVGNQTFYRDLLPTEIYEALVPVISACDSQVNLWHLVKNRDEFKQLFHRRIPKPINLKSLCRAVIIKHVNICRHRQLLPLPAALHRYLEFRSQ